MKHCLCCGKPLNPSATELEQKNGWHLSCIRDFFGTSKFPDIDVSAEVLNQLAIENTNKGYTVPGV